MKQIKKIIAGILVVGLLFQGGGLALSASDLKSVKEMLSLETSEESGSSENVFSETNREEEVDETFAETESAFTESDSESQETEEVFSDASETNVTETAVETSGIIEPTETANEQETQMQIAQKESKTLKEGWVTVHQKTYYYKHGKKQKQWQTIDGKTYYFKADLGYLLKGWITLKSGRYYANSKTGVIETGFHQGKKYVYYLDPEKRGAMHKGWLSFQGDRYYFLSNGRMKKGWKNIDNARYYFRNSGKMCRGFNRIAGKIYYFRSVTGKLCKGWKKVKGYTYYLDPKDGHRISGFKTISGDRYYFNKNDGRMHKGWLTTSDGKKYYMNRYGHVLRNGYKKLKNGWFHFDKKGALTVIRPATQSMINQCKSKYSMDVQGFGIGLGKKMSDAYNRNNIAVSLDNRLASYGVNRKVFCSSPEKKYVAFSFQAGYEAGYTEQILDILKRYNVKSTFYITHHYGVSAAGIVNRMIREGHEIGSHTYSCPDAGIAYASLEKQAEDAYQMQEYMRTQFGYNMRKYNYNSGAWSVASAKMMSNMGYEVCFCSVNYSDFSTSAHFDSNTIISDMASKLHPGCVYCFHMTNPITVQILPALIENARKQGYTVVNLD